MTGLAFAVTPHFPSDDSDAFRDDLACIPPETTKDDHEPQASACPLRRDVPGRTFCHRDTEIYRVHPKHSSLIRRRGGGGGGSMFNKDEEEEDVDGGDM